MTFSWIVTCTNLSAEQKVRESASFQNTKNKPALKLSRGILTADVNCTFNVTGSMSYDANIKSSVSVVIRALATPLDPYISGGEDCFMDLFRLLLSFLDVYLYFLSKNRFKREYCYKAYPRIFNLKYSMTNSVGNKVEFWRWRKINQTNRINYSGDAFLNFIPTPFLGDRQIGRDSGSVELDAETLTVDPDDLDDSDGNSFKCDWSCKDGNAPCRSTPDRSILLRADSPCITAVQSKHFAAGKSYMIRYG